ncbi:MAG TPA: EVE domain-containing protein [Gemmatimonadaceae bacterium]|nr:EVE domain-containing protein [Gemmatimonadaceae bacterium]
MSELSKPGSPNRQYWLLKADPETFSIDDLWNAPGRTTHWDGVRNFQARNFMREMKKGDLAFFYHSGGKEPGIAGIAEIVREAYPDSTALDPKDPHFDPRSKEGESNWSMVDVRGLERFSQPVMLSEMRNRPDLAGMPLLRKGNRLSVQKVGAAEWNAVLAMAKESKGA